MAIIVLLGSTIAPPDRASAETTAPAEGVPEELGVVPVVLVLELEPELTKRVLGHTSDVSALVKTAQEAPLRTWREQGERASQLADRDRAALVVWVVEMTEQPGSTTSLPSRTYVAVFLERGDRLYAHPVGPPLSSSSVEQRSTTLELAALTARAALQSLAETEALGIPLGEVEAEKPEPVRPPEVPAAPREPAARESAAVPLDGVAVLGAGLDGDGVTGLGFPSLHVGLGLERRRLRVLIAGEWVPRRERLLLDSKLQIERWFVGFEARLAWTDSRRLTPFSALSLGATAVHRTTETAGPLVSPTAPNTSWSPRIGASVGLEWNPVPGALDQRLALRVGAAYLPAAPVIELSDADGGDADRRFPLAVLAPFAGVDWVAHW